ncbi:MAG: hypothetical protein ABI823_08925 [Bryobacteraceae bacterium]
MGESTSASEVDRELVEEVHELERRVALLEQRIGVPVGAAPAVPASQVSLPESPPLAEAAGMVTVLGRALLGIAGGYLLRAVSESGAIPAWIGALATVLYAAVWLLSARRLALRSAFAALVHAATAALIVYPMLWETTTRLHILPSAAAAAILAGFACGGLYAAWPVNLQAVVWITTAGSVATALAFLIATRDVVPFAAALLTIEAAAEFCAWKDRWTAIRGLTAIAADLAVLLAVYLMASAGPLPEDYVPFTAGAAIGLAVALLMVSVGGTMMRTLSRGLDMTAFEAMQLVVAVALAAGGSLRIASKTGSGTATIAAIALACGAAYYLIAYAYLDRRSKQRNFYLYSSLALILAMTGSAILLGGPALVAVWSAAAIVSIWLGTRDDRATVRLHAAIYLLAATFVSGLLPGSVERIMAGPRAFTGAEVISGGAGLACFLIVAVSGGGSARSWRRHYAAALIAGTALLAIAGSVASGVTAIVPDADFNVPIRTAMLSLVAVALAEAGRRTGRGELIWLVYPTMMLAGYKLFARDFPEGKTMGFAISLLFFGAATMLLPRLLRSGSRASAARSN